MPAGESNNLVSLIRHAALVSRGGRITAANDRLSHVTGYSREELLGMRTAGLFTKEDLPQGSNPAQVKRSLPLGIHNIALVKRYGETVNMRLMARTLGRNSCSGGTLAVFSEVNGQDTETGRLPNSERLLEISLDAAESGVVVIASNGLVAFVNRKCCRLLGYDEHEVIGKHWAGILVTLRDRRRASEHFDKLVSGKVQPLDYYETTMPAKGGQKRIVSWHNVTLLRNGSGDTPGVIASFLDVTEQKKVLKTLEDRERLYTLVSENATAGVWTFDLASRKVTYMSPSISPITGFTAEETMAMGTDHILTPASLKYGFSELEHQLVFDKGYHEQSHSWTMELEEYCKDGSTVWVEVRTSVIRDAQGQPTGIFGITRDISERKQAEKNLQESEKRYRTLFENSMDAICIIGRNGTVLDANRAALDLLGYSREELACLTLKDIAPEGKRREFQQQIERVGYVRNFEIAFHRKDGAAIDCVLTFDLRRDDYGNIVGYEGSIRDVTEYKRLQRNLRLYVNEVTRAQESERLRLSRELHDGFLQNLLALGLELEKAIRTKRVANDNQKAQLQHIRDEVTRLAKELRAMSHALRPSVLDELGLVAAVQTMLGNLNEAAGIQADLEILGTEHRLSSELELALFRIVQEALNNVRQHAEARSVQVKIDFGAKSVKVTVSDDGKGFDSPRRLSDLASAGRMGLIGMEERARILGGRFSLQSKPNAGTAVTVEIPYSNASNH